MFFFSENPGVGENVEEIVCEPEHTAYENVQVHAPHKFRSKTVQKKYIAED